MAKPPLLYLVHRIPYPPNKGDKIRSFNILKHLAEHFEIYLGSFVDDPADWQHVPRVTQYCADSYFVGRLPRMHKLLALRAVFSQEPFSVSYYRSRSMQRWVDRIVTERGINRALLFCSPMAQFVDADSQVSNGLQSIVIDFVDVDSEKWAQYGKARSGLIKFLFQQEARRLLKFEAMAAALAQKVFFVSKMEADLFRLQVDGPCGNVGSFGNGVDTSYFNADSQFDNPYPEGQKALVFTGAMDYWPNVDAVCWFVEEVWPEVRESYPDLGLWVVGNRPAQQVIDLAQRDGVTITGYVDDVRPYLQHSLAAVAPMRVARGVQNKVIEAIAMGKKIVATSAALEGLWNENDSLVIRSDTIAEWVNAIAELIQQAKLEMPPIPRQTSVVKEPRLELSWKYNLLPLVDELLSGPSD